MPLRPYFSRILFKQKATSIGGAFCLFGAKLVSVNTPFGLAKTFCCKNEDG